MNTRRIAFSSYAGSGRIGRLAALTVAILVTCAPLALAAPDSLDVQAERVARALPLWSGLPFAGMLLSIALFPLLAPRFWEAHFKKVAIAWAFLLFAPFTVAHGQLALFKLAEVLLVDYLPFVILLWGLYTISGGIFLRATLVGTPALNTGFLAVGTVMASIMGTTGASMLFIRPLLRANAWRQRKAHVFVFLIFLVSNIGGVLTPLGDPPLFLGFIHGVPFFWTLRLLPHFLVLAAALLAVFFFLDAWLVHKEIESRPDHHVPIRRTKFQIDGWRNFLLLGGVLGAVLLSGTWQSGGTSLWGIHFEYRGLARDAIILVLGWISIRTTPKQVRHDNGFSWHAMVEVGYLFFGIFVTIIPVLMILRAGADGALGSFVSRANEPWQFFWMSGALSSFLDNAPTYLTFFNLALGKLGIPPEQVAGVLTAAISGPNVEVFASFLKAISAGAVFMGANTYIGNAPNFMVLSIAREHGVKMPSFFGYMVWSVLILVPLFIILTLVAF
jgi:Na+/H+ antiporter NhaD/arsenite permease-like protein